MWVELTKIKICEIIRWIMKILCLWYPSPMKKVGKLEIKNKYVLINDEIFFWYTPIYIGNIIYLAKIVRALSSNKIVFLHFCKKSIFQ